MSEKRKDKRGRILKDGESQRSDGRYMYRYTTLSGERRTVYSWRLLSTDKLPNGKNPGPALRDLEKEIEKKKLLGIEEHKGTILNNMFDKYMSMKKGIKPTSLSFYMMEYNKHVRNGFGLQDISKIKYSDVKKFYLGLHYDEGLNINIICTVNSLLEPTFRLAVRDGYINTNPCANVISEVKAEIGTDKEKKHGLTIPQQQVFLNYISTMPDKHMYNLLMVLLGTGCRIGEIIGLCWQDCDFENDEISIKRTMCFYKRYGDDKCDFHISTPKSKAGERVIPMFRVVRDALLSERELGRTCCREIEGVSGFVFISDRGNPTNATAIDYMILRIVERCNSEEESRAKEENRKPILLPRMSAHTLRHTFCTRLCENESNIKAIQAVMGHSSISVTMDIYTDVTQQKKKEIFSKLEGKLGLSPGN